MKTKYIIYAVAFLAAGCTDSSIAPLAGTWQGGFDGVPTDSRTIMRPEWTYKGYLQLYVTGMKCKMHLESEAQVLDITGTWSHKKDKIYVVPKDLAFDDRGGKLLQKPGLQPIDPTLVQTACTQELIFSDTDNPQHLTGLESTFGPMLGRFDFSKGTE